MNMSSTYPLSTRTFALTAVMLLSACSSKTPPPSAAAPPSPFSPPSVAYAPPGPFGPGLLPPGLPVPGVPTAIARTGLPIDLLSGGLPLPSSAGSCAGGLAHVVLGAGRTLSLPCGLPLPPGAPAPRVPVLRGPLPPAADLRALGLDGRIKDQERVGACSYFAVSTVLENALRRAGIRDEISPMHVISSNAWDDLFARPSTRYLAPEPVLPYEPRAACQLGPRADEGECSAKYGVTYGSWRSNPGLAGAVARADAQGAYAGVFADRLSGDPDEIAGEIARGRAVYAAFDIDGDAWSSSSVAGGTIPEHPHGSGGHAVVLVAYQTTPGGRFFLVHNSWGTDWGQGGYAWLSEANLRRNFSSAFLLDAYPRGVPVPSRPSASTSTPAPAPASCATPLIAGLCLPPVPALPRR